MNNHSLIEVAHMLYRIRLTIVNGECGLMESQRKFCPLYLARERWSRDLIQRLAHSIISQAFTRWAFISTFLMVLLVVRERLVEWSSWPSPITRILFTLRGNVRVIGGPFSPCMAKLPLQLVNLQLHGSVILFLRYVISKSRMASACMCSVHAPLSISHTFEIKEIILLLRPCGLLLMGT